jgi:hypothetical protein
MESSGKVWNSCSSFELYDEIATGKEMKQMQFLRELIDTCERQDRPRSGRRQDPRHFDLSTEQHPNSKMVARRFEVLHRRNCFKGVPEAPD